jgi:hypothetical protein
VLFQFIPAEYDQLLRVIVLQHRLGELLAERAGSPGYQNRLFLPIHNNSSVE